METRQRLFEKSSMRKRTAIVLALTLILTCFASVLPVDAASKPDMRKANVKWDLRNNKAVKFKTTWSVLGTRTHLVKMTNYKVRKAKKKGYKQCTFNLTVTRRINPTKEQVGQMCELIECYEAGKSENGPFGGCFYIAVVDYKTGKCLEGKNSSRVKVKFSDWKYSKTVKKYGYEGNWISYPQKATRKVTITYPKNYKNLAVGFGGYTAAPKYYTSTSNSKAGGPDDPLDGTGIGTAAGSGGVRNNFVLTKFWKGKKAFSKETKLYSKKDKGFAHFMRVK